MIFTRHSNGKVLDFSLNPTNFILDSNKESSFGRTEYDSLRVLSFTLKWTTVWKGLSAMFYRQSCFWRLVFVRFVVNIYIKPSKCLYPAPSVQNSFDVRGSNMKNKQFSLSLLFFLFNSTVSEFCSWMTAWQQHLVSLTLSHLHAVTVSYLPLQALSDNNLIVSWFLLFGEMWKKWRKSDY